MARLSFTIFKWDSEDVACPTEVKQSEEGRGAYIKLYAKELTYHCWCRTRGVAETEQLLQEVLDAFWEATDTMGVQLVNHAKTKEIWSMQHQNLATCSQVSQFPVT